MFCTECGHKNEGSAAFCGSCGTKLEVGVTPAVATTEGVTTPQYTPPAPNKFDLKKFGPIIGIGAVVVVIGIVVATSASGSKLPSALEACGLDGSSSGISLDSDNKTIYFDGMGEDEYDGVSYSDTECVLKELDAPDSLFDRIGSTNSLQGTVEGEWDNYKASWTYHPTNGLDLTLSVK